jgi:hypothetical protein
MRISKHLAGVATATAVLLTGAVAHAQHPSGWNSNGGRQGWNTVNPPGFALDRGNKTGWGTTPPTSTLNGLTTTTRNSLPRGLTRSR